MNLQELLNKYEYSKDIRRFSMYDSNHKFYGSVTSKKDIERYQDYAFNVYKRNYENYPIHDDDLNLVKESIKEYEICVKKGIAMMDKSLSRQTQWDITVEELSGYIDKLFELYNLYDEFKMRKLMQD